MKTASTKVLKDMNTLMRSIKSSDITALVGIGFNNQELLLVPELEKLRIPTIIRSASDSHILDDMHYFVETIYSDKAEGTALARALWKRNKSKVIIVKDITSSSTISEANYFADEFSLLGGKIVATHSLSFEANSLDSIIAAISKDQSKADCLLISADTMEAFYFWTSLNSQHITLPLVATASILSEDLISVIKDFRDQFNLFLFPSYWDPIRMRPKFSTFFNEYQSRFGTSISNTDISAVMTYDSIRILIKALNRTKSLTPNELIRILKSTSMAGITGHVSFTPDGYSNTKPVFYRVKAGKLENAD